MWSWDAQHTYCAATFMVVQNVPVHETVSEKLDGAAYCYPRPPSPLTAFVIALDP